VTGRLIGVLLLLLIWTCLAAVLGPLVGGVLRDRFGHLDEQPPAGVPQPRSLLAPRTAAASTNPQLVAAPDHPPTRGVTTSDPRLEPLRRELAGLGVSWQMTYEQAAATAALLHVHGPQALAKVALDLVTTRGKPTFARAWLGPWHAMPMPGAAIGEQRTAS
jgi:hypothetical protein